MNLSLILVLVFAALRLSDGAGTCTCKCCSGNGCVATELGTIALESCESTACRELCQDQYPQQCVIGPGTFQALCSSSSTSTTKPNWLGTYKLDKKCDQNTCCCPVGNLVLSKSGDNQMRIQCSFEGKQCPNGLLGVDDVLEIPTGFTTQIGFLGNLITVKLSNDGSKIDLNNPVFPRCSESATKNQAGSSATINMGLLSSFVALVIIAQFKM